MIRSHVHDPIELDVNLDDLKLLRDQLEAQQEFFRFGFDSDQDLVSIFEEQGKIIKVNPVWERELGWTEEELTAKPWREVTEEIMHPENRVGQEERIASLRRADLHGSLRRMKKKSGEWVLVEWHIMRFGDGITLAVGKIRKGEE